MRRSYTIFSLLCLLTFGSQLFASFEDHVDDLNQMGIKIIEKRLGVKVDEGYLSKEYLENFYREIENIHYFGVEVGELEGIINHEVTAQIFDAWRKQLTPQSEYFQHLLMADESPFLMHQLQEEEEGKFRLADSRVSSMRDIEIRPIYYSELVKEDIELFYTLPLTDGEKKIISKIVRNMGEKSLYKLLLKKKEMEKMGKKIDHVHTLRFLEVIFTDPHLTKCVRSIKKSSFKWDRFIKGIKKGLLREVERDNVDDFLVGFCCVLDAEYQRVKNMVDAHDWEGLVIYLM